MTTPRTAANGRNADKPEVHFNFDTWEQPDAPKPFSIVIAGKRYEALNPLDLDFREFQEAEDEPETVFQLLFPRDYKVILATKVIKVGALKEFNDKVMEHYGMANFADALR